MVRGQLRQREEGSEAVVELQEAGAGHRPVTGVHLVQAGKGIL